MKDNQRLLKMRYECAIKNAKNANNISWLYINNQNFIGHILYNYIQIRNRCTEIYEMAADIVKQNYFKFD